MASTSRSSSVESVGRAFGALAVAFATVAAGALLYPNPFADAFFAAWVLFGVGVSVVGGAAAWTNRTALAWVAALLLTALSVAGMMSVGFLIAPAALCLLGAAVCSHRAGPRAGAQEAILADPPTVLEAVLKTLVGIGSVVLGLGLVYAGAFARDLFDACASETLSCSLANTHWDAVGIALSGLVAVGLGCWLVWRQVYAGRVLASTSGAAREGRL